jgi:endonuclease/exonuclease/phosphatase family metal-dependent hydrolase
MMKRRSIVLLVFFLCIVAALSVTAETLTVVTINVWSGLDYKGAFKIGEYEEKETRARRADILIRQLTALRPDIVALNEANMLPCYVNSLARALNCNQVHHVGLAGVKIGTIGLPVNLREGDAILADKGLQMKNAGRLLLHGGPVGNCYSFHFDDATQIIAGRIFVGETEVYVFNTHWHASPFPTEEYLARLGSRYYFDIIDYEHYMESAAEAAEGREWRVSDAEKTVAYVDKIAGDAPVLLLGDLNATPDSNEIAVLIASGFKDAYAEVGEAPGYTWDGSVNTNIQLQKDTYPDDFWLEPQRKRIDYIFYRGLELEVISCEVVLDKPEEGRFASDHFGVMALFEVSSR